MRNLLVLLSLVLLAVGLFVFLRGEDAGPAAAVTSAGEPAARPAQPDGAAELVSPDDAGSTGVASAPSRRSAPTEAPPGAVEEDAERPGAVVRGFVVDALGNPVPGAVVLAASTGFVPVDVLEPPDWMTRVETRTDRDGSFVVAGIAPKSLRLAVRAPGYAPRDLTDLRLPDEDEADLEPIVLDRGVTLSGRVVDADGVAVGGAQLFASATGTGPQFFGGPARRPTATTDVQGNFVADTVAAGPWRLRVEHPAHPTGSFTGAAPEAGSEVGGLEFELPRGTAITGRVVGLPAGTEVRVEASRSDSGPWGGSRRTADVAADGGFTLGGVQEGRTYRLRLRDGGGMFGGRDLSRAVEAQAGSGGVVLEFLAPASVTARVVDDETGEPVEALRVEAGVDWPQPLREDGEVRTEFPGGVVVVEDLRLPDDGDGFRLSITSAGYERFEREGIRFAPGEALDLGEVRLKPVPTYRVRVLDAATRAPIEGARVTARADAGAASPGEGGDMQISFRLDTADGEGDLQRIGGGPESSGTTDADGIATLNRLDAERVRFRAVATGYARAEERGVEVAADEDAETTLLLSKGGAVLVRVVDPDGAPAAGRSVQHRRPSSGEGGPMMFAGQGSGERTNAAGEVRFDNLEVGTHRFRLSRTNSGAGLFDGGMIFFAGGEGGSGDDGWTSAEVVEGETAELLLTTPREGALVGLVTEAGVPLVGASLSLQEGEGDRERGPRFPGMGGLPEVRSGAGGAYRFDALEEGTYTLTVEHPSRQMPETRSVRIRGAETTLDVDLAVTVVEGVVRAPGGEPVPGVTVRAQGPSGGVARSRMVFVADFGDSTETFGGDVGAEEVRTDAEGRFRLRGLQADVDLVLRVAGDTIEPTTSESFRLAPGEVREGFHVEVAPGGVVEVEAYGADGAPLQAAMVDATWQGDGEVESRNGFVQAGRARVTGLRPGPWRLTLRVFGPGEGGGSAEPQVVEVELDEPVSARFDLE